MPVKIVDWKMMETKHIILGGDKDEKGYNIWNI